MANKRSGLIKRIDKAFSLFIRARDSWTCCRCGTKHPRNSMGLHNSHYMGRGNYATRWDPKNCDALCYGCHVIWGSTNRDEYRAWKVRQLGLKELRKTEVLARGNIKLTMADLEEKLVEWRKKSEDQIRQLDSLPSHLIS